MTASTLTRWLEVLLAGGWTPSPGEVVEVVVRHDDGCPFLAGKGECSCSPEVEIVAAQGKRA